MKLTNVLSLSAARVGILVGGSECPRAHLGEVGRHRLEHPHRDALDVEEDEVREHGEDVEAVHEELPAFGSEALEYLSAISLRALFLILAEAWLPTEPDPTPVPGLDRAEMVTADLD